jgi:hypothetical protein
LAKCIDSWHQLKQNWSGVDNFLMADQCAPFEFSFPSLPEVIEEVRQDLYARAYIGTKGKSMSVENVIEHFRQLPLDEIVKSTFTLAHSKLSQFDHKGGFLYRFKETVLTPWENLLRVNRFTWDRCYPIIFISGINSATNYHMDFSHVVAWQTHGQKRFWGLRDPEQWAPKEVRLANRAGELIRPSELSSDDQLCYYMDEGDVLWNRLLTPHMVETVDQPAMSINFSHGGLRLNGRLSPFESEVEVNRQLDPENAHKDFFATYEDGNSEVD